MSCPCPSPTPSTTTARKSDAELSDALDFATRLARKVKFPNGRGGIDYEAAAADAVLEALRHEPTPGMTFKRRLTMLVYNKVHRRGLQAARRVRRECPTDWEELDACAARPPAPALEELMGGLSPCDRVLAVEVLVEKVAERDAAARRGTNQWQVRKRLTSIRGKLARTLEDYP